MSEKPMGFRETIYWYDANANEYAASLEKCASPELLDKFAEVVGKGGKVLDAGCAAGRDTHLLKERGLEPVGVDISRNLLEAAKRKYPGIEFQYCDFLDLPFGDETFDGVWAHASLLHFETNDEVKKALHEFKRVLKDGGVLHVMVKRQAGEKKTEVVSDALSKHDRFFRWFTKDEVRKLLEEAGFEVVALTGDYKDVFGREEVKWIWALGKKL